jgi:hypothetical protein
VLDWDRRAVVYDPPISSKGALTGNERSRLRRQTLRVRGTVAMWW